MFCRGTTHEVYVIMGALFSACLFLGVNNASSVQPVVSIERTVFYREKAAGMYSPISYAIAQVGAILAGMIFKAIFSFSDCICHCYFILLTGAGGDPIRCSSDNNIWCNHILHGQF